MPLDQEFRAFAAENDMTDAKAVREAITILLQLNKLKKEGYNVGAWRESEGQKESVRVLIGY